MPARGGEKGLRLGLASALLAKGVAAGIRRKAGRRKTAGARPKILLLVCAGHDDAVVLARSQSYLPQIERAGFDVTVVRLEEGDELVRRGFRSALSADDYDVVWIQDSARRPTALGSAAFLLALRFINPRLLVDLSDDPNAPALRTAPLATKVYNRMSERAFVSSPALLPLMRRGTKVLPTPIVSCGQAAPVEHGPHRPVAVELAGHDLDVQAALEHLGRMYVLDVRTEQERPDLCAFAVPPGAPPQELERQLLERMERGIPCVVTPTDETEQLLLHGRTGFFAATEEDWRDYLGRLASDWKLRDRMGAAARRFVEEEFASKTRAQVVVDTLYAMVRARWPRWYERQLALNAAP